jgi:RNA recognition motif-containing protein
MASAARGFLRVFVGNLPWTIGSHELRQFASTFGPVQQAVVVFDKSTGLSKGYGFVTFANREAYNAATMSGAGSHVLEGNHVNIQTTTHD